MGRTFNDDRISIVALYNSVSYFRALETLKCYMSGIFESAMHTFVA